MRERWDRLWGRIREPVLSLWNSVAVQRVSGALRRFGAMLTAAKLGAWLDARTSDNAPPFLRLRARLGEQVARVLRNEQFVKIRISATLVLMAGIMTAVNPAKPMALVCAGMGFSFFGDAMLMQYPPVRNMVRQYFLWGMGFFAAAQAMYLRAMVTLYTNISGDALWPLYVTVFVFALFAAVAISWLVLFRPAQPLALRIGTLLYALLVSSMAGCAVAVCLATAGRGWPLLIGGPLFLISDFLIAFTDFGGLRLKYKEIWIWITYVPAQLLIILGMASLT